MMFDRIDDLLDLGVPFHNQIFDELIHYMRRHLDDFSNLVQLVADWFGKSLFAGKIMSPFRKLFSDISNDI